MQPAAWWRLEGPQRIAKRIVSNTAARSAFAHRALRTAAGERGSMWDDEESRRKNSAEYSRQVFALLAPSCPATGRVLELGPGTSLGVAKLFAKTGHETYTLDKFPWTQHESLEAVYAELGVTEQNVERRLGPAEAIPFPDGHFAFVYSNSVLEHVRDPGAVAAEIARVLAPGGVTSHAVDVNDHRDYEHPLEFLRIPAWAWEAMYSHKSSYHNRCRASQLVAAFRGRFATVDVDAIRTLDSAAVGDPSRFVPPYSSLSVNDLAMTLFRLTARRAA